MGKLKIFAVVVLCAVFVLPTYAESNNITIAPVQATQPTAEQNTACAKPASQNLPTLPNVSDEAIRIARAEMERDAYKQAVEASQKAVELTKWIFTSMLSVFSFIMVIFGSVLYKETGKHREVVVDAREASKEAREVLKDVRTQADMELDRIRKQGEQIMEQADCRNDAMLAQATNEIEEIRNLAKIELDKIKDEGKEQAEKMTTNAETERKVSELWNNALRLDNEGKHEEACDKYAEIVKLKPNDFWAYYNCGIALARLARLRDNETFFEEACSKYVKAIEIKADYYEAYNKWGVALARLARLRDNETLFEEACSKYAKAIEIKADGYDAYSNWGIALSRLAGLKNDEALFKEACSKCAKAIEIKADYCRAYYGWGIVFLEWARLKIGTPEYDDMLKQANEMCLKAESLRRGSGAYNLACVSALRGDKDGCRKWLNVRKENGTLPTREYAMKDSDLASVRGEEWFKAIKWKGEK
jgi:tetratricopeptide (TPR) repeat protein